MNILITGATGLIGTHLRDQLCASGNLIIYQTRKDTAKIKDQKGVKWIKHDLLTDSWDCLE